MEILEQGKRSNEFEGVEQGALGGGNPLYSYV